MDNLVAFLGDFLLGKHARNARAADDLWDDETPIPAYHPLVPKLIREDAVLWCNDGDLLFRLQTPIGIEWQVRDADGRLQAILPLQ